VRILVATLRKLVRRPASYVSLGLVTALLALVFVSIIITARVSTDPTSALSTRAIVSFPGAWTNVLQLILGVASFLALAYAGAVAGSEWSWGTLKAAVARGESRGGYQAATLSGVTVAVVVGLLVLYLAGVALSIVGSVVLGQPLDAVADPDGISAVPEALGRAVLALALYVSFGYAVATVARSQIAGIAVAVVVYFVEGIARFFLSDLLQWSPFAAAEALVSGGGSVSLGDGPGSVTLHRLEDPLALVVTLVWIAVGVAVAVVFTERAEIGG
jgi:hypothetical protein